MRHLVAEGQERGLDLATCLAGTQLDAFHLDDPAATVAAWEEITVAGNIATVLRQPSTLGLSVGQRQHISTFGAPGIGMLSSTNLFSALNFGITFSPLLPALCVVTAQTKGSRVAIRFDGQRLPAPARELLVVRDLTALIQSMRETIGGPGTVLSVELEHDAPVDRDWEEFFGGSAQRGEMNRCILDLALMTAPLPQADPIVESDARRQCQALMADRRASGTVVNQVLDRLWSSAPDLPSFDDLARALLTTGRTLRRRLSEEGTTFRVLIDQVQFSIAKKLLGAGQMSVQQIAHHLGYGDTSAFTHAFRRWSGKSPRAYVNELVDSS